MAMETAAKARNTAFLDANMLISCMLAFTDRVAGASQASPNATVREPR